MSKLEFTQTGIRDGRPWWVAETRHYIVLFDEEAKRVASPAAFGAQAERRLERITALLGIKRDPVTKRCPLGEKLPYFVHGSGACTHGNVDRGGIDVPLGMPAAFYRHEESHFVHFRTTGHGLPPLLGEGFAKYAEAPRSRRNHRLALAGLRSEILPSIVSIAADSGWWREWRICGSILYEQAASLTAYLFARFGRGRFLALCGACRESDALVRIRGAFRSAYGVKLSTAEEQWKAYLYLRRGKLQLWRRASGGQPSELELMEARVQRIRLRREEGRPRPSTRRPGRRG